MREEFEKVLKILLRLELMVKAHFTEQIEFVYKITFVFRILGMELKI